MISMNGACTTTPKNGLWFEWRDVVDRKHVWQMISITLVSCFSLYFIEQVLQVSYVIKTAVKIIFFLIIPLLYIKFGLKKPILHFLNVKNIDVKRLKLGCFFGAVAAGMILFTYVLLKDVIQTDVIIADLQNRLKITPKTYLFIALYITFGNSLLEEFYFRGFIFLQLYRTINPIFAYLFSSVLFAVYHVAIFATWFNGGLILLALSGLTIVGLIFNWLNTKSNHFLNSWILHILADISIVGIGFYLFFS